MKVVLDTNVLVSALVFPGGAPEQVYRLALEGVISLVTSPPLVSELGRVLTEKFLWELHYAEAALAQVVRISEIVEPTERVAVVTDDPDDDRVLQAATTAGAEAIVTGDHHLLELGRWRDVAIQSPADFIDNMSPGSRDAGPRAPSPSEPEGGGR